MNIQFEIGLLRSKSCVAHSAFLALIKLYCIYLALFLFSLAGKIPTDVLFCLTTAKKVRNT